MSSAVEDLLVVPQEFAGDSPNSRDCVLLLKQWVCSTELAQAPILILPAARLSRLAGHLTPVPRNVLSKDAIKEYRKTAERVAKTPWNLMDAQRYLFEWTRRNAAGVEDEPGSVDFVMTGRSTSLEAAALPPDWRNFAPA